MEGTISGNNPKPDFGFVDQLYAEFINSFFRDDDAEKILKHFDSPSELASSASLKELASIVDLTDEELDFVSESLGTLFPITDMVRTLTRMFWLACSGAELNKEAIKFIDETAECRAHRIELMEALKSQSTELKAQTDRGLKAFLTENAHRYG